MPLTLFEMFLSCPEGSPLGPDLIDGGTWRSEGRARARGIERRAIIAEADEEIHANRPQHPESRVRIAGGCGDAGPQFRQALLDDEAPSLVVLRRRLARAR